MFPTAHLSAPEGWFKPAPASFQQLIQRPVGLAACHADRWFSPNHVGVTNLPRLRDGTPLDASRMIVLLFLHTYIDTDQKAACFKLIG